MNEHKPSGPTACLPTREGLTPDQREAIAAEIESEQCPNGLHESLLQERGFGQDGLEALLREIGKEE